MVTRVVTAGREDDSFVGLLDSPVGAAFCRNADTAHFQPTDPPTC